MRKSSGLLILSFSFLLLAACGTGSSSSSTSDDWFYHWNCNGDSQCLATNPSGTPTGTLDEGPVEVNCTQLEQFAQNFWGSAATDSCDHNSGSGGGTTTLSITGFAPTSTAPGNKVTITGTGFPSNVTVTIDGITATIVSVTDTQIVITVPTMVDFTGPIVVGGTSSTGSFAVTNHLYGVTASGSQFLAVGASGTILTSSDGVTWTARTSGTSQPLFAVARSASEFVAVGESGTLLDSSDGINWVAGTSGVSANLFGVNWSGTQFIVLGANGTILTSPDGAIWTPHSSGTGQTLGSAAWSGSQFAECCG